MNISVVVPAYNVEGFLRESVNSLLSQTVMPFEVVIVNDGSTDSTGAVAECLAENSVVRVVHTDNRGLGAARNLGQSLCTGDYVYFFDSDDLLEPDFIEAIQQTISKNDYPDLVFFSGSQFLHDHYQTDLGNQYSRGFSATFDSGVDAFLEMYDRDVLITSACLYVSKNKLWGKGKLAFKSILHEDEEILFPLFLSAEKVAVIDRVYFHRRIRSGSIMTTCVSSTNAQGFRAALESLMAMDREGNITDGTVREAWRKRLQQIALKLARIEREIGRRESVGVLVQAAAKARSPYFVLRMILAMLPLPIEKRLRTLSGK